MDPLAKLLRTTAVLFTAIGCCYASENNDQSLHLRRQLSFSDPATRVRKTQTTSSEDGFCENMDSPIMLDGKFKDFTIDHDNIRLGSPCVFYLRNQDEWGSPAAETCASSLEVLAWLTDRMQEQDEKMIIAYGELIHTLREKEFVNPDGSYMDDDIDTWVTPTSYQLIKDLEPDLWRHFGWSLRVYLGFENTVKFGQLVPHCGHEYNPREFKTTQDYPPIDMYLLQEIESYDDAAGPVVRDNWQGPVYYRDWFFPTQSLQMVTRGLDRPIHLELPANPEKILECLYGDWTKPSKDHANGGRVLCYPKNDDETDAAEEFSLS